LAIENIKVPDLGDASEVEVIELLVAVGDEVSENDSLLVLESDKAAMEIPAPMSGVVKSISVNLGDQVSTGSDILTLEVEGEGSGDDKADSKQEKAGADEKSAPADSGKADDKQAAEDKSPAKSDENQSESASSGGTSERDVEVPDLGTDDEVEVIEVHVKDGDEIAAEDSLITLESDKAAMEVPAPEAGKVKGMQIKVGDKVKTGAKILVLEVASSSGASAGDSKAAEEKPAAKEETAAKSEEASKPAAAEPAPQAKTESSGRVYAGPAVRKLARELGVDLTQVQGSGAKSRITKEDLHDFVKNRINAAPAAGTAPGLPAIEDIDFSKFGEIEEVQRSKLEKVTAVNMHRNWMSVPHVAQFNEADVTELEDFRAELKGEAEKRGTRLTFLPFLLKACARTLQEYPQFNVSLHSSGEKLIQKKYYHIGVAVATPAGLVVPVIRDVDKKSIWELAEEVLEISDKAKQRKLSREDMQGACFTISSLGAIGGTGFIPIINAPEVAILGVSKTTIKPVYMDGEFKPRKMLPLTLSYDHRAVNGVDGGMFADYLVRALGDIRRLIL
jgi:pyruvate dehydrogenase E2 component (dihydrolipoamide acetyltransferase)